MLSMCGSTVVSHCIFVLQLQLVLSEQGIFVVLSMCGSTVVSHCYITVIVTVLSEQGI